MRCLRRILAKSAISKIVKIRLIKTLDFSFFLYSYGPLQTKWNRVDAHLKCGAGIASMRYCGEWKKQTFQH